MAENIVQVTEGSGKKLHTWDTTIGANLVQDEFVVAGEYPYATYTVQAIGVSAAAADDLLQIMAGASLKVRLRYLRIEQAALAGAASAMTCELNRVTSAGTGGTAVTAQKMDNADAAAGATCAQGVPAATHGTAAAVAIGPRFRVPGIAAQPVNMTIVEKSWYGINAKGPVIPAGATNGLVLRVVTVLATATWDVYAEFVETAF